MKLRKHLSRCFWSVAVCFVVFLFWWDSGVAALDSGAYVVPNTTYYVNPDTGKADDGGDTSTGEGMCRNATYTECLYEYVDGKHYVTLRIKLISYISDIHFYVQQSKGNSNSYKEVSYTVTGENTANNTKDFLFQLPSSDVLIKPAFFVGPMNRDVTYFIGLNMGSAKAGTGTFTSTMVKSSSGGGKTADSTGTEESTSDAGASSTGGTSGTSGSGGSSGSSGSGGGTSSSAGTGGTSGDTGVSDASSGTGGGSSGDSDSSGLTVFDSEGEKVTKSSQPAWFWLVPSIGIVVILGGGLGYWLWYRKKEAAAKAEIKAKADAKAAQAEPALGEDAMPSNPGKA